MASAAAQRRVELRDRLFTDADERTWNRKTNDGYFTVPRLLPYIMCLIRSLAEKKGDPSAVYFDLWSRAYDEGMATITDEAIAAFESGYSGTRAVRTWRERMRVLEELGFIQAKPSGNRQFAHVLIINPLQVVCQIRGSDPSKVPDELWNAFLARAQEIGASLPFDFDSELPKVPETDHEPVQTV